MTSFGEWLRGDAAAFGNVAATVDNPSPAAVGGANEQPPPRARAAPQATRTPGLFRAMTLIPPAIGVAIILAAAVAWLDAGVPIRACLIGLSQCECVLVWHPHVMTADP